MAWLIESAEGGPTVVDALEDVADLYRGRLERRLDRTTVLVRPIAEQAREAVMDNQIPQTAAVKRGPAKLRVDYDGTPKFKRIEGTNMEWE